MGTGRCECEHCEREREKATAKVEAEIGNEFFIVMRDTESTHISKRHPTHGDALNEAKRLSEKEHNKFFVLAVVTMVEPVTTCVINKIRTPM